MCSRWYNVAVILLWLSAMGWLVVDKVLPPLCIGEPPSYREILDAQQQEPAVGWEMFFDGRPLGWARSSLSRLDDGTTEIHSRVHFNELPLQQLAPAWLRALIDQPDAPLEMDAENTMTVDPLGRLSSFRSFLRLDPLEDAIKLQGIIDGNQLKLSVSLGGPPYPTKVYLPADALLGDALSPQTQLPGLHAGQTWTVPVYSPLRPPNRPLEILQATVEGSELIQWNDGREPAWLVVYRSDRGFGLGSDSTPRGRLWVRHDGTVLKQQVMLFNSTLTFVRLPNQQAEAPAEDVDDPRETKAAGG